MNDFLSFETTGEKIQEDHYRDLYRHLLEIWYNKDCSTFLVFSTANRQNRKTQRMHQRKFFEKRNDTANNSSCSLTFKEKLNLWTNIEQSHVKNFVITENQNFHATVYVALYQFFVRWYCMVWNYDDANSIVCGSIP